MYVRIYVNLALVSFCLQLSAFSSQPDTDKCEKLLICCTKTFTYRLKISMKKCVGFSHPEQKEYNS